MTRLGLITGTILAGSALAGASSSAVAADVELVSATYRLRGSLVGSAHPLAPSGGAAADLVGGNVGAVTAVFTGVGDETGIVLHGGLWPAMVGAAFDQDRDLVPNVTDNCTAARNTLQLDADHDGFGNACDVDLSNDGVVNFVDLARLKAAFFTSDPVADLNGDGLVNFLDLAIMKRSFFKAPGPAAAKR